MTTRSASLPAATEPSCLSTPRILRAVERHDLDRLDRREAGLDQQLVVALVAVARAARRPCRSGSTPAPSRPPAFTNARSNACARRNSSGIGRLRRARRRLLPRASDTPRAPRARAPRARDPRAAGGRDTTARRPRASTIIATLLLDHLANRLLHLRDRRSPPSAGCRACPASSDPACRFGT